MQLRTVSRDSLIGVLIVVMVIAVGWLNRMGLLGFVISGTMGVYFDVGI